MKKLLTLVLAGVALNYFLKSEKGADLRNKLMDWLDEAQDGFNDLIRNSTGKVEQTVAKIDKALPGKE